MTDLILATDDSPLTKPLVISADDYSQSSAIDEGILGLIRQGIVTATSCLVMSPRWPAAAPLLDREIREKADVGLHLDFTEFNTPLRKPLPMLAAMAHIRALNHKHIEYAINTQLDQFESFTNSAPDYIDGHQHVHQLPQIRDCLLDQIDKRKYKSTPWIRVAKPAQPESSAPQSVAITFKTMLIDKLGADALLGRLKEDAIPHTKNLLGIYGFNCHAQEYLRLLNGWLNIAQHQPEVCALMCHPAKMVQPTSEFRDPILNARLMEGKVLAHENFSELLISYALKPTRLSVYVSRH